MDNIHYENAVDSEVKFGDYLIRDLIKVCGLTRKRKHVEKLLHVKMPKKAKK